MWQSYAWTAITAANFDAAAPGLQTPDFSVAGAPIQFGFYRSNSTSVGGGGGTVSGGIDNWSVTVYTPVTATKRSSWGRLKTLYAR